MNTCFQELADEDRTYDKLSQCQIKVSTVNSKCNIKGLNQAINSRFKNKSALFGTVTDLVVESGLAAVYAFMDDEDGKANSKVYTCASELFDSDIGTSQTVEDCMAVVNDLFQSGSALFETTLGTF